MIQYVIYDHPRDYPDHFVVRRWRVLPNRLEPDDRFCILTNTLDLARESIPAGLVRIGRLPDDDPVIVEVWT